MTWSICSTPLKSCKVAGWKKGPKVSNSTEIQRRLSTFWFFVCVCFFFCLGGGGVVVLREQNTYEHWRKMIHISWDNLEMNSAQVITKYKLLSSSLRHICACQGTLGTLQSAYRPMVYNVIIYLYTWYHNNHRIVGKYMISYMCGKYPTIYNEIYIC